MKKIPLKKTIFYILLILIFFLIIIDKIILVQGMNNNFQPGSISNPVFHFDAQDINGDNIYDNNPAHLSIISLWKDKFNSNNAIQNQNSAIYYTGSINGHPAIHFNGNNLYSQYSLQAPNTVITNISTFKKKSFAIVFKTGNDITTLQEIYRQGGGTRGYTFKIENGNLYVGAYNNAEWDLGHRNKIANLGAINTNEVYYVILVQDSTSGVDLTNTIKIYLNGILNTTLNHVDEQKIHSNVLFGINLNSSGAELGEIISWNHSLTTNEISSINSYLLDRWEYDYEDPEITNSFPTANTLYPHSNFNISFNYDDNQIINSNSENIELYKWDGISSWGSDISATGLNLGGKIITSTGANYPTFNLNFGKYKANFTISDMSGNSTSTGIIFYIDNPEFIINSGSLDIGNLKSDVVGFSSDEITITVKTVGASFDVILNKNLTLSNLGVPIDDWDGNYGFGYEKDPYSQNISTINLNEIIATQGINLNTSGNKNTYTYKIKLGALIKDIQQAGNYNGSIDFGINLDY